MRYRWATPSKAAGAIGLLAFTSALAGCGDTEVGGDSIPSPKMPYLIRIGTGVTPETEKAAYVYAAALNEQGYSTEIVETGSSRDDLFESMGVDTHSLATADPSATAPAEDVVHIVPDLSGDLLLYLTDNGEISPTTIEENRETARAEASAIETPLEDADRVAESSASSPAGPTPEPTPSPTGTALNIRGLTAGDISAYIGRSLPDTVDPLDASKATNRYGYAITAATAEKYGIRSMEDLSEHCKDFTFAVGANFDANPAGPSSLKEYYGCTPGTTEEVADRADRSWQLITAEADVAYLFSSSTDIDRNNLTLLDDPQGTQLAQNIVPLTRAGELPTDVQDIINGVSARLDTPALKQLEALTQGENPVSEIEAANFWLDKNKG